MSTPLTSMQFSLNQLPSLIFIFIFLTSNAFGYDSREIEGCEFKKNVPLSSHENFDSPFDVSLEIVDNRKWKIQGLKIITENTSSIRPKHKKKRFKALFSYEDANKKCKLEARIRQSGDWRDHIQYVGWDIRRSIDIRLKKGSFLGATKFKLLLPETRNSKFHVLGNAIFKAMDFLSPETRLIEMKIGGVDRLMLFEEKITKEFLESNNRRESAILEGDESLIWNYKNFKPFFMEPISLARLVNISWAKKSENAFIEAVEATSRLQKTYASMRLDADKQIFIDWTIANPKNALNRRKPIQFDLFLIAAGASHGLRPSNRKFYFDPFKSALEPIVYDSNIDFKCCENSTSYLGDKDLEAYSSIYEDADFVSLQQKLKAINYSSLNSYLKVRTVEGQQWEDNELREIIEGISDNLKKLQSLLSDKKQKMNILNSHRTKISPNEIFSNFISKTHEYIPKAFISNIESIDFNNNRIITELCDISGCNKSVISKDEALSLLSMSQDTNDIPKFHGNGSVNIEKFVSSKPVGIGFEIRHSPSSRVTFDKKRKTVNLLQGNPSDQFLIMDADIENLVFQLSSLPRTNQASDSEKLVPQKFTGCVTFYETKLKNIKFFGNSGLCEDQVNFVKSDGQISNISIENAFSDGVDIDFSKLSIDSISVSKVGNDCLDFSGGDYNLNRVKVKNCPDKGISVGEKSNVKIEYLEVASSDIGIAVKDSSFSKIKSFEGNDLNVCAWAFNKKQEFFGGSIILGSVECPINRINSDRTSFIFLQ